MPKSIFEWHYQGTHYFFKSQGLQKVAKNDTKTGTKNSTLKSIETCSKMTSFSTPCGGGPPSHVFYVFWYPGPKWCPRGLQGEPRGAQSHSKYQFLMIFGRLGMDFDVIWATFECSRECPSHKMNVKIWAAFPLRLKSARVPKFGQHSPSDSATKVNIKVLDSIPSCFSKVPGSK